VLGLFSFAGILMHRDLDPASWPADMALEQRPLLRALLAEGFRDQQGGVPDEAPLDEVIGPREAVHVLDADASQGVAIEEVRRGRNLLIQGPPGTGKSQTIVNLIAQAVRDGRTVLLVAQKMAALDTVKRASTRRASATSRSSCTAARRAGRRSWPSSGAPSSSARLSPVRRRPWRASSVRRASG
jgi:AAA domain